MTAYSANVVPFSGTAVRALLTAAPTPANGDTAPTGTGTFLLAENTSGGAITITVTTPGTLEGDLTPLPSRTHSVVATNGISILPLTDLHRDPTTGLATINYSATASLKVVILRVP